MLRRLADLHLLDEITDDRHQALLGELVGIAAGFKQQGIHDDPDARRIELVPKTGKAFRNVVLGDVKFSQFGRKLRAANFELVEFVVEGGAARPAFIGSIGNLLDEVLLISVERFEFLLRCRRSGRFGLQLGCRLLVETWSKIPWRRMGESGSSGQCHRDPAAGLSWSSHSTCHRVRRLPTNLVAIR